MGVADMASVAWRRTVPRVRQRRHHGGHIDRRRLCYGVPQAREAIQIKGEVLANMSREIRAPISAIIGLSQGNLFSGWHPALPRQSHV